MPDHGMRGDDRSYAHPHSHTSEGRRMDGRRHGGPGDEDRSFSRTDYALRRGGRLTDGGVHGTPDYDPRRADRERWEHRGGYRYGHADERRFDNDDEHRIPKDETDRLISSSKVEGTAVFDPDGERIGTVESFMVTKRSGRVEYAVLSFGGFMGMGERHYPIDWEQLTYDERREGYVVDLRKQDLDRGPRYSR